MPDVATLAHAMDALRLLSMIVAMATIVWWTPSLLRVFRGTHRGTDAARAIWVTLAWSILLFQVRWLAPGLDDLTRKRIWVVAQAAMAATQIASIYHNGGADPRFDVRRTMLAHAALVALCFAFAWVPR